MLNHEVTLCVGDRYRDGHGITDYQRFKTSHDAKEINKAFNMIAGKYDLDITEQCADYQNSCIDQEFAERLFVLLSDKYPKQMKDRIERLEDDDKYWVEGSDDFAELYLMVASLGLDDFAWNVINDSDGMIDIGGYGLLSN